MEKAEQDLSEIVTYFTDKLYNPSPACNAGSRALRTSAYRFIRHFVPDAFRRCYNPWRKNLFN